MDWLTFGAGFAVGTFLTMIAFLAVVLIAYVIDKLAEKGE